MSSKMDDKDKLLMIGLIEKHPQIWRVNLTRRPRNGLNPIYEEIAATMEAQTGRHYEPRVLRYCWRCLSIYFRKLFRVKQYNLEEANANNTEQLGTSSPTISSSIANDPMAIWRFSEPMRFLLPVIEEETKKKKPRKTKYERLMERYGNVYGSRSPARYGNVYDQRSPSRYVNVYDQRSPSTFSTAAERRNQKQEEASMDGEDEEFEEEDEDDGEVEEKMMRMMEETEHSLKSRMNFLDPPSQLVTISSSSSNAAVASHSNLKKGLKEKLKENREMSRKSRGKKCKNFVPYLQKANNNIDKNFVLPMREEQHGAEMEILKTSGNYEEKEPSILNASGNTDVGLFADAKFARSFDQSDFFGMHIASSHRKFVENGMEGLALEFQEQVMSKLFAFERRFLEICNNQQQGKVNKKNV